jgi:hypothetical protein
VIMQVWISTRFGVISKRTLIVDESFRIISADFHAALIGCKVRFSCGFWASRPQAALADF